LLYFGIHAWPKETLTGSLYTSICIDPKELNKALKRERYPIPVIEDVWPELSKARVFTKVDARNSYWHVVLDDESATLMMFDTPFGRYYWKRIPFGLSVSSEIFQ